MSGAAASAAAAASLTTVHGWAIPQNQMVMCDPPKIQRTLSQSTSSGRHDNTLLFKAYTTRFGAEAKKREMPLAEVTLLLADIGITNKYLAARIFAAMDADKGGTVEYKEMNEFCKKAATGSYKEKGGVIFSMCDLSGEGEITKEDMRTMLFEMTKECLNTIPDFGLIRNEREADLYAHLTEQTLAQVVANRIVTDMFMVADTDKSGTIDKKEFMFWVQRGGKLFDEFVRLFPVFNTLVQEVPKAERKK